MDEYVLIVDSPVYGRTHYAVKGSTFEEVLADASRIALDNCYSRMNRCLLVSDDRRHPSIAFILADDGNGISVIGLEKRGYRVIGRLIREVPFESVQRFDPYVMDKYADDARSDLIAEDRVEQEEYE